MGFFLLGFSRKHFRPWTLSTMEELTKSWRDLSLSEREGPDLYIKEEQAMPEFSLAAKFLTKHALNCEAIANTFQLL